MRKRKDFYNARDDKVFKAIFADPADTFLLETLLNLIFNTKVKNIKFENSELLKRNVIERAKTCDFVAEIDNKKVHIELNNQYQNWLHFRNFNFFSTSIDKETEVGKKYDIKKNYIHIDFTYSMPNSKNLDCFIVYKIQNHKQLSYVGNVYFVEFNMDKIKTVWYNVINKRKRKLYYYLSKLDIKKEELEIEEDDEFVKKLKEKIKKLNQNKEFVSFLSRDEDIEFQMNTERSEGFDEGITQGKIETAKNLLNEKIDFNIICKTTGLTEQEVLNLQKAL